MSANPNCKEKMYFRKAETTFKLKYSNHKRSFKFSKHKADTVVALLHNIIRKHKTLLYI